MLEKLNKSRVPEFSSSGVTIRTEYSLGSFPIGQEKGCSFAIYDRVYSILPIRLPWNFQGAIRPSHTEMMSGIQPPGNAHGSTYGAVMHSEGVLMNSITIDGIITYPPVRVPSESSLFAKFSIKSTAAGNTLLMRVRCYEELAESNILLPSGYERPHLRTPRTVLRRCRNLSRLHPNTIGIKEQHNA